MPKLFYRSIFISDVHMGTRNCKANYLLDFLRSTDSEYLYLVGDIFDLWAMKKSVYWTKAQSEILQTVFEKAENGVNVIYIPGNHDSTFRDFTESAIRNIDIKLNAVHETQKGKRLFVSHGDEFDILIKHNAVLKYIGDQAYELLLRLNQLNTRMRRWLKKPYWSLSGHLKSQVKNANEYIKKYEHAAVNRARQEGYDGYICGHIHKSGIRKQEGILYCNTGDWVEHCTALVEDETGHLKIMHWSDHAKVQVAMREEEEVDHTEEVVLPFPLRAA
jgi:UDP-2,3-diacylglucosamine pyrophosphatase LpxH